MRRWMGLACVALAMAGCKKKSGSDVVVVKGIGSASAPVAAEREPPDLVPVEHRHNLIKNGPAIEQCKPPITQKSVYEAYKANGGTIDVRENLLNIVYLDEDHHGFYFVIYEQGSDMDTPTIAHIWECKLYMDDVPLVRDMLRDDGWDKADPATRAALVWTVLDILEGRSIETQPADWDTSHTFAPPRAKALPDGGLVFVRWTHVSEVISYEGGEFKSKFVKQAIAFSGDGVMSAPRTLEETELKQDH